MFSFWYKCTMLAFESCSVIALRAAKISCGGMDGVNEAHLMIAEKAIAGANASLALLSGVSSDVIVEGYRALVAANEARLTA